MLFEFPKTRQVFSIPKEEASENIHPLTEAELEDLGIGKKEKIEKKEVSNALRTKWKDPENGVDKEIEINLENYLAKYSAFYKEKLKLNINESKIKDIWKQNYAEIKKEVEKYGYDSIIIIPDNLPEEESLNKNLIETMDEGQGKGKGKVAQTWQSDNFTAGKSFAGVLNSYSPEYRIILTHSIQNIEDHSILKATRNKNIMQITGISDENVIKNKIYKGENLSVDCEVEINGIKIPIQAEGISLEEYLIQQRVSFDEKKEHLDEKSDSYAWLLKSFSGSRVMYAYWDGSGRRLAVAAFAPGDAGSLLGVRLSRSFSKKLA